MCRHLSRRFQIFRNEIRRHEQRFARVGKTFAGHGVFEELFRGAEVDASQISDRIIVFCTRQSPHQHKSRITGTLNGIGQHEFLSPADQFLPFVSRWLRFFFGRHLTIAQLTDHLLPNTRGTANVVGRME